MTEPARHRTTWRRGFFTGRQHAVPAMPDRMTFHGMTIAWSLCGLPTVEEPNPPRTRACRPATAACT